MDGRIVTLRFVTAIPIESDLGPLDGEIQRTMGGLKDPNWVAMCVPCEIEWCVIDAKTATVREVLQGAMQKLPPQLSWASIVNARVYPSEIEVEGGPGVPAVVARIPTKCFLVRGIPQIYHSLEDRAFAHDTSVYKASPRLGRRAYWDVYLGVPPDMTESYAWRNGECLKEPQVNPSTAVTTAAAAAAASDTSTNDSSRVGSANHPQTSFYSRLLGAPFTKEGEVITELEARQALKSMHQADANVRELARSAAELLYPDMCSYSDRGYVTIDQFERAFGLIKAEDDSEDPGSHFDGDLALQAYLSAARAGGSASSSRSGIGTPPMAPALSSPAPQRIGSRGTSTPSQQ